MRRMLWAPVLAALLTICGSAWAAPATVHLRVEGATSTIFEGPVTTDGKVLANAGNAIQCDGTGGPGSGAPGPTAGSALDDASIAAGFRWDVSPGGFVNSIAGEANDARFWGIALNNRPIAVGGCLQPVGTGDEVLFAFDFFDPNAFYAERPVLALSGPGKAAVGQPVNLAVEEFKIVKASLEDPGVFVQGPAAGAGVAGATSGSDGIATATFPAGGLVRLKAERAGSIRSNALLICVSDTGTGDCGVPPAQLGTPVTRSNVTDSAAPVARISGPRNGRRYRRGPRLLRGTASDDGSGVQEVKLSIRRHVKGKGCQWWSGRRDRFVGRNCRKTFFFGIGKDASWSYLLPRALGPGRYVIDLKVFDARRNRNERFVAGENRTIFEVIPRRRNRAAAAARAIARVQTMVVGQKGVIAEPTVQRVRETVVRASGRRCAVAASTPLAALAAVLRREKVRYAVRDFGSCSPSATGSSRQLFVTRIARERNSGQDGWVYKVNDRAPSRGAADQRIKSGDRLVWLYCETDLETGGCQRTLRAVPAKRSGLAGESLSVRVFGYDDKRKRKPAPGARVTLSAGKEEITSAVAAADGSALLTLPGAGRYTLSAEAAGLVPSFPLTIRTR